MLWTEDVKRFAAALRKQLLYHEEVSVSLLVILEHRLGPEEWAEFCYDHGFGSKPRLMAEVIWDERKRRLKNAADAVRSKEAVLTHRALVFNEATVQYSRSEVWQLFEYIDYLEEERRRMCS